MSTIKPIQIGVKSSLLIGVSVPTRVKRLIDQTLKSYGKSIDEIVLANSWFLVLTRTDSTDSANKAIRELSRPMILPFVATVSLTHIGVSNDENNLWAYAQATPVLESLNELLANRLGEAKIKCERVTASINLGRLSKNSSLRIPDVPLVTSFQIEGLKIVQEDARKDGVQYSDLGSVLF